MLYVLNVRLIDWRIFHKQAMSLLCARKSSNRSTHLIRHIANDQWGDDNHKATNIVTIFKKLQGWLLETGGQNWNKTNQNTNTSLELCSIHLGFLVLLSCQTCFSVSDHKGGEEEQLKDNSHVFVCCLLSPWYIKLLAAVNQLKELRHGISNFFDQRQNYL